MSNLLCHPATWGSLGNVGAWGWLGVALTLIVWVGLLAGLTLLVVLALRRARVSAATAAYAAETPTAKERLQAQYARGEITREQYELRKRDMG